MRLSAKNRMNVGWSNREASKCWGFPRLPAPADSPDGCENASLPPAPAKGRLCLRLSISAEMLQSGPGVEVASQAGSGCARQGTPAADGMAVPIAPSWARRTVAPASRLEVGPLRRYALVTSLVTLQVIVPYRYL